MTTDVGIARILGERIRIYRDKMGISQEQVARVAGVDRNKVKRLESGDNTVKIGDIELILQALDISLVALLMLGKGYNCFTSTEQDYLQQSGRVVFSVLHNLVNQTHGGYPEE